MLGLILCAADFSCIAEANDVVEIIPSVANSPTNQPQELCTSGKCMVVHGELLTLFDLTEKFHARPSRYAYDTRIVVLKTTLPPYKFCLRAENIRNTIAINQKLPLHGFLIPHQELFQGLAQVGDKFLPILKPDGFIEEPLHHV